MRRTLATLPLLVVALVIAVEATAGSAEPSRSGIKGRVVDATCLGPCTQGQELEPYLGDDVRIVVRKLRSRNRVARLKPHEGRFRVAVAPGRYRLRARFGDRDPCWEGSAKGAKVKPSAFTRVRLQVENACIR